MLSPSPCIGLNFRGVLGGKPGFLARWVPVRSAPAQETFRGQFCGFQGAPVASKPCPACSSLRPASPRCVCQLLGQLLLCFISFFSPLWPAFDLRPEKIGESRDGTPERGAAPANPSPCAHRGPTPFFFCLFIFFGVFLMRQIPAAFPTLMGVGLQLSLLALQPSPFAGEV